MGIVTFGFADELHALEAIQELRRQDKLPIGLVSDRADDVARSLAAALGFELHAAGMTSEAKRDALASLRERGFKAIYVGDCRRHPEVAREAFLAISVTEEFDPDNDPAAVLVLRRDLGWLGPLRAARDPTSIASERFMARCCCPTPPQSQEHSSWASRVCRP